MSLLSVCNAESGGSGKPAGTTFTYRDTRVTKVANSTNNDDGFDYLLKSSVVKMDWSNFYKA